MERPKAGLWTWQFPMKPVRIERETVRTLRMSDYWVERKYDGIRVTVVSGRDISVYTRHGRRYDIPASLMKELRKSVRAEGAVLDGELWDPRKRGGWEGTDDRDCLLTFWDCVSLRGRPIGREALEIRAKALAESVSESARVAVARRERASEGILDAIEAEAKSGRGDRRSGSVHGAVLKRVGSPRRDHPNRSVEHADWLKIVFWA